MYYSVSEALYNLKFTHFFRILDFFYNPFFRVVRNPFKEKSNSCKITLLSVSLSLSVCTSLCQEHLKFKPYTQFYGSIISEKKNVFLNLFSGKKMHGKALKQKMHMKSLHLRLNPKNIIVWKRKPLVQVRYQIKGLWLS